MKFFLLTTTAATLVAMAPALAQGGKDEIVVTAQMREQSLQEVPLAITAVGADDIERLNAADLRELQYAVPNLVIAGSESTRLFFSIRGISDRARNPGYDNRVGVYIDGVWIGRQSLNQSTFDVASIEVLRGPQGTLFGKNTVSGAISVNTKPASDELGASITVGAGNYDMFTGRGAVDIPLSDSVRTRFGVSGTIRDGYVEDVLRDKDYDDKEEIAFRGQVDFDMGASVSGRLSADFAQNDFTILVAEQVPDTLAPEPREVALSSNQAAYTRGQGVGLNLKYDFASGYSLTSITGFRASTFKINDYDEDYSPLAFASVGLLSEDAENISQEIRFASPDEGRFNYVLGLYYLSQDIEGSGDATVLTLGSVAQQSTVDATSLAAFAHGNVNITDFLQLTAGVRYTHEEKDFEYSIADTSGLFTNGTYVDSRSSSDWSPKASLNWFVTDDVMAYVGYSKGFKSGGWNADFISILSGLPFDDEKVNAYEIGLRTEFFDRRLRLNLNGFYQEHSDFQVFSFVEVPPSGTIVTVSNAGEVTTKGFEMEANVLVSENFEFWANYGYTDATFDSFANGGGTGVDFDGNRLSEAPKHNFAIGAEFRYPFEGAEIVAQTDYAYRGEFYSNPNNLDVNLNDSLGVLNARLGVEFGAFSVYLWGKNLTDETKQIYNQRSFLGFPRATFNDPRTYGVTLSAKFGGAK